MTLYAVKRVRQPFVDLKGYLLKVSFFLYLLLLYGPRDKRGLLGDGCLLDLKLGGYTWSKSTQSFTPRVVMNLERNNQRWHLFASVCRSFPAQFI